MHGQRENSIPTTNKVCMGYKKAGICYGVPWTAALVQNYFLIYQLKHMLRVLKQSRCESVVLGLVFGLMSHSTAMVMTRQSVNLTMFFPGQA